MPTFVYVLGLVLAATCLVLYTVAVFLVSVRTHRPTPPEPSPGASAEEQLPGGIRDTRERSIWSNHTVPIEERIEQITERRADAAAFDQAATEFAATIRSYRRLARMFPDVMDELYEEELARAKAEQERNNGEPDEG